MFGQAAGAQTFFAASSGASDVSQSRPTNRQLVMPFERSEASQTIGACMTSGWTSLARSNGALSGMKPVFVGPPGTSTFTVTPVPSRSLAQVEVAASSAAFD